MTFAAVGSPVFASTLTFSLTPHAVGNFILAQVVCQSNVDWATAMSSSNVSWSVLIPPTLTTGLADQSTTFIGLVTAASAATVTITLNTGTPIEGCVCQEFSTTAGFANVLLDTRSLTGGASVNNYPPITPSHGAGELYFCYAANNNVAIAGSTPGYTYYVDTQSDGTCFNPSCTNTVQAPVWGDTDTRGGVAVMLYERPSVPSVPSLPAGYVVQATDLNQLSTVATFLMAKPYAHITDQTAGSAIQAFASGPSSVLFGGITQAMIGNGTSGCIDTDGMYSVASSSVALDVNTPGWYLCRYGIRAVSGGSATVISAYLWFTFGANNPLATFYPNGIPMYQNSANKDASNDPAIFGAGGLSPVPLFPGDTISLIAYCDTTTGATAVGTSPDFENTFIEAEWVSSV